MRPLSKSYLWETLEDLHGIDATRPESLEPLLLLLLPEFLHLLVNLLLGPDADPLLERRQLVVEGLLVLVVRDLDSGGKRRQKTVRNDLMKKR